jgi:methanogenic corrinoid protein MtbC1
MWERRYSAVQPYRTDTGRRLYTDAEIERLVLLRRATLEGQSISRIAQLPADELRALIPADPTSQQHDSAYDHNTSVEYHLNLCLQAMENLYAVGLETCLLRASVSLDQQSFLEELLHPFLEQTGEMWSDGRLRVAHEHMASAVVRSLLGHMYASGTAERSDPMLVSATPLGQQHEFGALMALITASTCGWRTLYLGSSLPAEEIMAAAEQRNAGAIALSIVFPANDPRLPEEFRKIDRINNRRIPLLVGGRSAIAYEDLLVEIGAVRIRGLVDLRRELDRQRRLVRSPSYPQRPQ